MKQQFSEIYWPLRIAYGLVPLLAGLDKFVGILADWEHYVSPTAASLLPISVQTFMHLVGIVEILAGLAVLFGITRLGAFVVMGWLVAISLNLLLAGYLDIAIRDLVMAIGAYTLSVVAAKRGEEYAPSFAIGMRPLAHQ